MHKTRAGIVGYGNMGRGAEKAIQQSPDFELAAVLTRRSPEDVSIKTPSAVKIHVDDALSLRDKVDIMILCGGSMSDLPVQGPAFAKNFNTVDSFDTHAKIPEYFNTMDEASKKAGRVALISAGWDPGLFSMNRVLAQAVLPHGSGCTFWGKGVSQGHSDAIRRVDGVEAAVQYTIPIATAIEKARKGNGGLLTTREKHIRECFVVAEEGADKSEIENSIKTMPHYFSDYDTIVHFISKDEFTSNHSGMPHGGFVIHSGKINDIRQTMEFSLNLSHNAEFTASVLIAYARAAYRYYQEGKTGALTVLDIPLTYLSLKSDEDLRKELL
ncbi:MAG: diaminopimelate dehydrogenase [Peptococcaceae bacterium]|nr:diaminopimelate dehydrogenase [Peptococcaceae bacterium]